MIVLLKFVCHIIRNGNRFLVVRPIDMTALRFIFSGEVAAPHFTSVGLRVEGRLAAVVDEDRLVACDHIVRVAATGGYATSRLASPATSGGSAVPKNHDHRS
ncbi:hypothetical protein [Actinoplanes sp. ATCC 53533]|uniref:hypothetical protein n=1 Tax=Actinoplanes sp. ATCC 53533 TaxID=1288362 RepID=UPI000F785037|nr:hypothetical protein [Actinoplanes sp. ATCC 53533]